MGTAPKGASYTGPMYGATSATQISLVTSTPMCGIAQGVVNAITLGSHTLGVQVSTEGAPPAMPLPPASLPPASLAELLGAYLLYLSPPLSLPSPF